jgi:hypothetical protein
LGEQKDKAPKQNSKKADDLLHRGFEDDQMIVLEADELENTLAKKDRCGEQAGDSLEKIKAYAIQNSKNVSQARAINEGRRDDPESKSQ